jgi:hypothetical protein
MALVNAGRPRTPANEDAIIRTCEMTAVYKLMWYHVKIGTIPTNGPQSTSVWSTASIAIFAECTTVSRQMQFCKCLWQHVADEHSLHSILCRVKACFMQEGGFNIHNSPLWTQDNPHAIWECGYQVCFSVSVWAGIVRNIVVSPYLLPDRLTVQRYRHFLDTVLLSLLADVPIAVRQCLWFQHFTSLTLAQQSLTTVMKWKRPRVEYTEQTNHTMHCYQHWNPNISIDLPKYDYIKANVCLCVCLYVQD